MCINPAKPHDHWVSRTKPTTHGQASIIHACTTLNTMTKHAHNTLPLPTRITCKVKAAVCAGDIANGMRLPVLPWLHHKTSRKT